jgi:carbon-monoxide dehydrogenase large subunit
MAVTEAQAEHGIGAPTLRKEDAELITGQAHFVDDITLPGLHYLAFVRSPFAHAMIRSIDGKRARALPGVVAVLTYDDLAFHGGVPCGSNPTGDAKQPERPPLARDRVRMLGEPVAVVVAETRYAAADGAEAVDVDYEPLPVVVDVESAMEPGAPQLHDDVPNNRCCTIAHETEGFAEAIAGAKSLAVSSRTTHRRVARSRSTPQRRSRTSCGRSWPSSTGSARRRCA